MLVAMASAKGSPGASTSAHVLAAVWPRQVLLAELDPVGSDLAYRTRTREGAPPDGDRGVVSLAVALRRDPGTRLQDHLTVLDGGLEALVGLSRPDQAAAIGAGWSALATSLRGSEGAGEAGAGAGGGRDVVADVGRIGPGVPSLGVALTADLTVLVTRPGVEHYGHLRERLAWLREETASRMGPAALGVVLIAPWRSRHEGADLARLLQASGLEVPVLGVLAEDAAAADVLAGRRQRPLGRSLLVRSARALASSMLSMSSTASTASMASAPAAPSPASPASEAGATTDGARA
ncbi:hypothetical protein [Actinomyces wuliandei]|uniref:hypothetical protein n=1 Tax=Actinomyces wuliandei TaxID=2057743 RepID=UPI001FA986E2|nr:hypothetical protein [Actinomyces wuliandei]